MSQAKSGNTVKIHCTGTLEDGSEFDSSAGREPLEFEPGGGQVIPGFDNAVDGNHPLAGKALTFAIELVEIS